MRCIVLNILIEKLSLQRIIKLSKPTAKWRPAIEKETGTSMKPAYPAIDTISNGKTQPPGFQNPSFDGSLPNMTTDSTQL